MNKFNKPLYRILYIAILLTLTLVLGRFFLIPVPFTHGNVNLCDAGILIAALLLGPRAGAFVGGFGGLLLDLISGYSQYMFFSFIVHGLQGFLCGWIYNKTQQRLLAVILGCLLMVGGYFIADSIMYAVATATLGIGGNVVQAIIGIIVSLLVTPQLQKRLNNEK